MADLTKRATLIVQFQNEIDAGAKSAAGSIAQLNTQASATESKLKSLSTSTEQIGSAMSKAGKYATIGLTLPLAGVGAAAIKMAMDMEQTTVAFTTLTGSAENAKKHLDDLRAFAASTPFEFTELTQASKRMMAFGFETNKIVPMLRDIGDATSALGLGGEGIDRITRALGQMSAKGKVSGEEMMQLTEAGLPGWRYLAEAMGVTTAQVMKMSEKGLIPAKTAIDALLEGMRKDFGGMMAEQSKTAAGQLSNLKDSVVSVGTSIGQIMLPTVKSAIGFVSSLADTIKGMTPEMQQAVVGFGLLAAAAGPVLSIGGKLISTFSTLKSVALDIGGGMLSMGRSVVDVGSYLKTAGVSGSTLKDAFVALKSSGALLTGELALLAAGLMIIVKFLGEVDAASKAASEDLVKMANSSTGNVIEDTFKRAGAATEIMVNGQDRIRVALDGVNEKLKTSADSYADYRSSIEATARAAGLEIDAMGNLIQVSYGMGGRVEKLVQANYALSESGRKAYEVSLTQAYGIDILTGAARGASNAVEQSAKKYEGYSSSVFTGTQEQISGLKQLTDAYQASGKADKDRQVIAEQMFDIAKANNGVIADSYTLAISYTESAKQQADIQQELAAATDDASRAGLEHKAALEGELAALQKSDEITRAKGAFESLTKSFRDGVMTQAQYEERATALNKVTGLYTESALKQATAQELLMNSFADPRSEAWKGSLEANKTALDGLTDAEKKATDQAAIMASQEGLGKQTESAEKYREALGRIPQDVEVNITQRIKTVTDTGIKAIATRDQDTEKREESAAARAAGATKTVGDSSAKVITTLADTQSKAAERIRQSVDTTETRAKAMATTLQARFQEVGGSIVNAFASAQSRAQSDMSSIISEVNKLPTFKEFVYKITVRGRVPDVTGGVPSGGGGVPEFAGGGSMLVPSGYPNDTYPILVSSGEKVTVQTPAQQKAGGKAQQIDNSTHVTNVYNPLAAAMLLDQQRRERLARSNARMGV